MINRFTVHFSPSMDERMVSVYLPPAYGDSDQAYPVMYMFDGQNAFEEREAAYGKACLLYTSGKQLGSKLDFPTANLLYPKGKAIPPRGVYAARAYVDGQWHIAAVNIGTHPTAPGGPATIEANLLDYEGGSLYEKHMRLLLCRFIRPERKFASLEELKAEVMKNREQVRTYFEK